ncbi:hypothetical protein [Phyllobacterium endophyticum]|jgi:hypothetical protein|uniref:Uncharacterized protein n=1 Tax=Phyllobacterium endophyticum TaxID=1149773 RepID=A0A2P7AVZ8_9HYPH|nr:hypothetical protein [Phyllobacterium endophyticum]MBB3234978.1 hypothetical protein [Phyllobacterium endophyticum]PSH58390.1 hypothetical protein CU100_12350 [Phyllobacterium endophyticum]TXR47107.1 hypothetical protein FVA77_21260 [Phyllobacterium endophyticum]TYR39061.1 hypothetical protein FY050_24200 [Phyllobacterium endophyticum]
MNTRTLALATWSKTIARFVLERGLLWLRHSPRAKALVLRSLRAIPALQRRLFTFAQSRGSGLSAGWTLEPEQTTLDEWQRLLDDRAES